MEKEIRRPLPHENAAYYTGYINQVPGDNFMKVLVHNLDKTTEFLEHLSPKVWDFRYADGKWTTKEVVLHVIDSERIFAYRALCIARHDQTPLAGFDQDAYVPNSHADLRSPGSLIEEFRAVRAATIALFKHFTDQMITRIGTASGNPFSPLALGFIIAGHEIHHLEIIKTRYLTQFAH